MEEKQNKAYYAIIPANVRYDAELPANAKLLYGEITALCNEKGYCWATNKYFAELYGVSNITISRWIKALNDGGHINSQILYKEGTKEIEKRYITLINNPIKENDNAPIQKSNDPINKIDNTPINKNVKDNNTSSFNTTFNKKKERKPTRYDEILSKIQDEALKELYLEYIKMRKLIKSPLTDRALTMLINKVNELEPGNVERQKQLLETAIMNNWKSVYPLKDDPKPKQQKEPVRYGGTYL